MTQYVIAVTNKYNGEIKDFIQHDRAGMFAIPCRGSLATAELFNNYGQASTSARNIEHLDSKISWSSDKVLRGHSGLKLEVREVIVSGSTIYLVKNEADKARERAKAQAELTVAAAKGLWECGKYIWKHL